MEDAGIYAREAPSLGRAVQLGIASGRVISVSFPDEPPPDADPDHPLLDRVADYLGGAADDFRDVDLALTVPTEQRRVLEAVRTVPYGETVTVGQLARMAGLDGDETAPVRTALGANPTPLLLPDHRVSDAGGATPAAVAERLRDLEA